MSVLLLSNTASDIVYVSVCIPNVLVLQIGGLSAFLVLLAFAVVQQFVYPGVLALTWNVWFAALFLPIVGWVVGFGLATMFLFEVGH